jgi:hypothetical protein
MPARTTRKILKLGGTTKGIALPLDWLRALKLDLGDTVDIIYGSVVLVKPQGLKLDFSLLKKELEMLARDEEGQWDDESAG